MEIIPKSQIIKLIEIMKTNNINKMTFVEFIYNYQINSYKGYFEIIIKRNSDILERYVIDRV